MDDVEVKKCLSPNAELYADAPEPCDIDGSLDTYLDNWFFHSTPKGRDKGRTRELECCYVIKCVLTDILGWTPDDAYDRIDDELINGMRLGYYKTHAYEGAKSAHTVKQTASNKYLVAHVFAMRDKRRELEQTANIDRFSPGQAAMDWYQLVGDVFAQQSCRRSVEDTYATYSDSSAIRKLYNRKNRAVLLNSNVFYPIQLINAYLVKSAEIKAEYETEDDLLNEDFLYFVGLIRAMTDHWRSKNPLKD